MPGFVEDNFTTDGRGEWALGVVEVVPVVRRAREPWGAEGERQMTPGGRPADHRENQSAVGHWGPGSAALSSLARPLDSVANAPTLAVVLLSSCTYLQSILKILNGKFQKETTPAF